MSTPITETITENMKAVINEITIANSFNQDLVALRKKKTDFYDIPPEDGKVLIMQIEDETLTPELSIVNLIQNYLIIAVVLDTDKSTDSIETKTSKVRDDIRKKLVEDVTRGGVAIDTMRGPATPFDDGEGLTGIILEIGVQYRTAFADPYTQG